MGQWLKAVGGYSVEQIGEWQLLIQSLRTCYNIKVKIDRLLSLGIDGVRDRLNAHMRDLDGLHAREMARAGLHVDRVHYFEHFDLDLEYTDCGQVLCLLFVLALFYSPLFTYKYTYATGADLSGASYAGQATTFA